MVKSWLRQRNLVAVPGAGKNFERGYYFPGRKSPRYFFQLIEGCIKMVSHGEDDKSFTQGIFTTGQCFGEP